MLFMNIKKQYVRRQREENSINMHLCTLVYYYSGILTLVILRKIIFSLFAICLSAFSLARAFFLSLFHPFTPSLAYILPSRFLYLLRSLDRSSSLVDVRKQCFCTFHFKERFLEFFFSLTHTRSLFSFIHTHSHSLTHTLTPSHTLSLSFSYT